MSNLNPKSSIFMNTESLTWVEAEKILSTFNFNYKKHVDHISNPLGGEVFVYFQGRRGEISRLESGWLSMCICCDICSYWYHFYCYHHHSSSEDRSGG